MPWSYNNKHKNAQGRYLVTLLRMRRAHVAAAESGETLTSLKPLPPVAKRENVLRSHSEPQIFFSLQ